MCCRSSKIFNRNIKIFGIKKNLQHFWNTSPKIDKLSLEFFHGRITATEDKNQQTGALFPLLGKTPKDNIKKFVAVLMSKDFLNMLLGKEAFEKFINGPDDANRNKLKKFLKVSENSKLLESAFLRLNILNDANGILAVSWWFKHAVVTMESGETHYALLNFHPVFAYDISNNTVQFIRFQHAFVVDVRQLKDKDLQIYSDVNVEVPAQKDSVMDVE